MIKAKAVKEVLLFSLLFFDLAQASEQGGIVEQNYEINFGYSNSSFSRDFALDGTVHLPIKGYIAANLGIGLEHDRGKENIVDADRVHLDVSIFMRNFEIGRLETSYGHTHSKFDVPAPFSDTFKTHHFRALGAYYFHTITTGISRSFSHGESGGDANVWTFFLTWYPVQNTKFLISTSGMDAKDSYSASLSHQPNLLNNTTEISLSYGDSKNNDIIAVNFTYFFGTQVNLKERDRKYR